MIKLLILIGLLLPTAYAQEEDTLYKKMKRAIELESHVEEASLPLQRFAIGVFHDTELDTADIADNVIPFEIRKEDYVDYSLRIDMITMCGDADLNTEYFTCLLAQTNLRQTIQRNFWLRRLGRELQAITSGYEMGIDGYPAKPIDVISRFSSITHLWRAANDPFVAPIVEVLTRARPWPRGSEDSIKEDAEAVVDRLKDMVRTWTAEEEDAEEKEDRDDMIGAIWRYRHGVQYVIDHEGKCADAPEYPDNPANVWLERRWCDLEDDLQKIRTTLQKDSGDLGNDEQIIYPSFIDKKNNIYIWMRYDDVGLQWYIPIEPVQAALFHPDFGDCLDGDEAKNCYDTYSDFLVRGGQYPSKQGEDQKDDQPLLGIKNKAASSSSSSSSSAEENDNAVVPEPIEGEGICSHPFSKRGYLCRRIEYEACDITKAQEKELKQAGTGGIVLTRCQPERFKDDVARRISGSDICGIGGWKETVQENLVEDTPDQQLDMRPNKCAACAVDVVCKDTCVGDSKTTAFTSYIRRNDVIEICVPNNPPGKGLATYLLAHELIHAQQVCNQSTLQSLERAGILDQSKKDPAACCSQEREAYFAQCKMYAIDGILDKAGVTIDQCASAYANFSCKAHDEDEEDNDYVCTNDGIDPQLVAKAINAARDEIAPQLNIPSTCVGALNDPRIQAIRNSIPLSCKPGCQSQYQNTIGNNLCYTGQCLEETHEFARDIPGRMGLTTIDEGFPWDACEKEDPQLGRFDAPPAITAPRFPLYRPALMLQQLDIALCQINGLPARTPPALCGFDAIKRLGLPPLELAQSALDLNLQPQEYDATGLGIQLAASAIGSRIATDMFTQYLSAGARQFTDLLNTMYHVLDGIGDLEFPSTMCPRYTDSNFSCRDLE